MNSRFLPRPPGVVHRPVVRSLNESLRRNTFTHRPTPPPQTHSLTHSLSHTHTHTPSHTLTHSLTRSFTTRPVFQPHLSSSIHRTSPPPPPSFSDISRNLIKPIFPSFSHSLNVSRRTLVTQSVCVCVCLCMCVYVVCMCDVCAYAHSFIRSFTHSFTLSFIHLFIHHSFIHSHIRSSFFTDSCSTM